MRAHRAALLLTACLLFAGCTFLGGDENSEDLDRDQYDGGAGLAVALRNNGTHPFAVKVNVVGFGGQSAAQANYTLDPGDAVEKWWTLGRGRYTVQMTYTWTGDSRSSSGADSPVVDLQECPLVSRLGWTFVEGADKVGTVAQPKTCTRVD